MCLLLFCVTFLVISCDYKIKTNDSKHFSQFDATNWLFCHLDVMEERKQTCLNRSAVSTDPTKTADINMWACGDSSDLNSVWCLTASSCSSWYTQRESNNHWISSWKIKHHREQTDPETALNVRMKTSTAWTWGFK